MTLLQSEVLKSFKSNLLSDGVTFGRSFQMEFAQMQVQVHNPWAQHGRSGTSQEFGVSVGKLLDNLKEFSNIQPVACTVSWLWRSRHYIYLCDLIHMPTSFWLARGPGFSFLLENILTQEWLKICFCFAFQSTRDCCISRGILWDYRFEISAIQLHSDVVHE